MDSEQEKHLIELAKHSPEAFGELYEEYYSAVFGYVLRRTASIEISQDVTAEVFLKALKNLERFQYRASPFSAWLYRIAANEIANYHRRNHHCSISIDSLPESAMAPALSAENELIEAETELERNQEFLLQHAHIKRLKMKYQEIIVLRYFENKSIKEISAITCKSEGTVKSLIHRALAQLRKEFEKMQPFRPGPV
jgi:RNA polymerase sigma-70 factor (ECF subfamily)